MTDLFYALGVGFSFSIGVFAGAYLCRSSMSAKDNSDESDLADHCSQVEARLSVYAENTTRMADALDKIASIENNQLETLDEKTGTSYKIQFIKTKEERPFYGVEVLIRVHGDIQEPTYKLCRTEHMHDWFEPFNNEDINFRHFYCDSVEEWAYLQK